MRLAEERVRNLHHARVTGHQPAAVAIAVDLDQHGGLRPAVPQRLDDGARLVHRIEDRRDVDASVNECPQPRELVGCEADGVSDVGEPAIGVGVNAV